MGNHKSVWPYIKGYKFNSLLAKNFLYVFLLVTIPLLLVLSLNYKTLNRVVDNRVMEMNGVLLQKSAVVTDNIMNDVLQTLDKIVQLSYITEIVQMTDTDSNTYINKANQAIAMVNDRIQSNNYIVSAYIYSDLNEMLLSDEGAQSIHKVHDRGKWYNIHKQTFLASPYVLVNHANSIFVCQPIWIQGGHKAGLFVVDVELQKIRDLLENEKVAQQGAFFIMDISGQLIYCNEKDFSEEPEDISHKYEKDVAGLRAGQTIMVSGPDERIVSVTDSMHKSWKYALVTETPDYKEETAVVSYFLISSIFIGIVASLIAAYIITYLTYRPFKKIVEVVENPQLHWNEREATKGSNEMLYITSNILSNRLSNKEMAEELEERVRALRQAQFRALQFQIDPHFLYNTLETIKWNAVEEMGLGNKTSKMLTKVARLYRLGLENDDVIVTLKEELDFLKLYIEIVRIRFGDAIQFHWDIDERLYECNIIKMCLQPIVENAIQHGLRPKNYQGNITVSAKYEKERLCVCIANDGQYMSGASLKELNEKLKTGAGFEESKVGLRNVNERIKLIYGKKYGVSVSCSVPKGETPDGENRKEQNEEVRVTLTFPCRNLNRSEENK